MSRRGIVLALSSFFLFAAFPAVGQKNQPTKEQQQAREREEKGNVLKNWIRDEVAYIVDSEEEAAFKSLKTDLEREQAIEAFWFRRDPTPDTIDNEYKDDYYTRIALANERYTSGIPGWRTDRGKMLIMHGEPDEVETHAMGGTYYRDQDEGGGVTSTFPFERWRYRYIEGIGNNVILEFVDASMSGEYRLSYDPSEKDALLHVPGVGLTDYEARMGLDKADRLNRDSASLGNPLGASTRVSDFDRLQLFNDIQKAPQVKFKDLDAIVTSRVSYNVLPFDLRADFIKITENSVLTPITVQIAYRHLAFKENQGFQQATGRIEGRITNLNGRTVQRIEDFIEVSEPSATFRPDKVALYQKPIMLAPGLYKLFVAVNDSRSGNTGTLDQRLEVKRFPEGNLSTSSLILADLVDKLPPRVVTAQFQIGSLKVRPSVKNEFKREQSMNVFLQIYGLKVDEKSHKPSVSTEVLITRDGREVRKIVDEASEVASAAQQMNFTKEIAMADFEPGQYDIQIRVKDNIADGLLVSSGKFTVR